MVPVLVVHYARDMDSESDPTNLASKPQPAWARPSDDQVVTSTVSCRAQAVVSLGADTLTLQAGSVAGRPWVAVAADIDGGLPDIITGGELSGALTWFQQTAPRTFAAGQVVATMGAVRAMATGLIDGDSRLDLAVVAGGEVSLLGGNLIGHESHWAPRRCSGFKLRDRSVRA